MTAIQETKGIMEWTMRFPEDVLTALKVCYPSVSPHYPLLVQLQRRGVDGRRTPILSQLRSRSRASTVSQQKLASVRLRILRSERSISKLTKWPARPESRDYVTLAGLTLAACKHGVPRRHQLRGPRGYCTVRTVPSRRRLSSYSPRMNAFPGCRIALAGPVGVGVSFDPLEPCLRCFDDRPKSGFVGVPSFWTVERSMEGTCTHSKPALVSRYCTCIRSRTRRRSSLI